MVKELREKTGAGMMDCKKALAETNGDMEAAIDWLRAKGIAKADKKSGRTAAEGLIGIASAGTKAVVVEVNSETDFVARNDAFQDLVRGIANVAVDDRRLGRGDCCRQLSGNRQVRRRTHQGCDRHDRREHDAAPLGPAVGRGRRRRNLHPQRRCRRSRQARRSRRAEVDRRQGSAERDRPPGRHAHRRHQPARHPLRQKSMPAVAERERNVFIEQSRASGKPDNIIEKMVDGRMRKFFEEVALLSQAFVMNPDLTVGAAVKEAEKTVGAPIEITGMARLLLGEGVEKEETDFAAEVAAVAKG